MRYFYYYLAVGIVVMLVVFISHRLTRNPEYDLKDDLMNALYPERKRFWYQLLVNRLVPLMAGMLMVVVWPVAIYIKAKDIFSNKTVKMPKIDEEDKEFAVNRADLLQQMSINEINLLEKVYDPIGATPNVAFGHLNPSWVKFTSCLQSQDEIWTFSANWTSFWGGKDVRTGYAILRDGKVSDYFISNVRAVESD